MNEGIEFNEVKKMVTTNVIDEIENENEGGLEDDEDNEKVEMPIMSESKWKRFNLIKELVMYIVNYLVSEEETLAKKRILILESDHFADKREEYLLLFDMLVKKFKQLKKTKEEKTKFCMRKAFRFLFA